MKKVVIFMNHWDEKFNSDEYIYGTEPNEWVKSVFDTTGHSNTALLAEGEGRNAVYLAKLGHQVTTYDSSQEGIRKTEGLAESQGVHVDANLQDITVANALPDEAYDASINIFGHVPAEGKAGMFANLIETVQSGGLIVFELYSKRQLEFKTGGPKDINMLFSIDEIHKFLSGYSVEILHLEETELERHEGIMHKGKCAVIQGKLRKL